MGKISFVLQKIICIPIKLYQYFISPVIQSSCRYYPSCSHYAESAIEHYGVVIGLWMTVKRVARCNPWALGGYDPVVPNDEKH